MENDNWKKVREDAEALRDEIRLQVHLAGMDARSSFARLEKEAEHLKTKLTADARSAWTDLVASLKKVREQIRADVGGMTPPRTP